MLLITVPDAAGIRMIVEQAREIQSGVLIVTRAPSREHLEELRNLGVYEIVQPEFEAGLEMVRQVLARFQYSPADILRFSDTVHRQMYRPLLEHDEANDVPLEAVQALDDLRRAARGIEIEWISVPPGSGIIGRSLVDVAFRTRTGASIVAARDGDGLHPNPVPGFTFQAGDSIGVLGTEEQRREARSLIESDG